MSRLTEHTMLAFQSELRKLAFSSRLGAGATLGVLGGALGGLYNYNRHQASGEEGSGAAAAAKGALLGAAVGGASGAVLPRFIRDPISRFGLRQLHGITGYLPEGESLRTIRTMSYDTGLAKAQAQRALLKARRSGEGIEKAQKQFESAAKTHAAVLEAEQHGLTSIPGIWKAIRKDGFIPTLARGAKSQWAGSSPLNKAVMVGLPAVGLVQAARSPDLDAGGRGEVIGEMTGQLVGGTIGSLLPFGAGIALQEATGKIGRLAGKGVDIIRGRPMPQPYGSPPSTTSDLTQSPGEVVPREVLMTARAAGIPPEHYV